MNHPLIPSLYLFLLLPCVLICQTQLGASIEDPDSTARIGVNMDFSADGSRLLAGAPNASTRHWLGGKVKVFDLVNENWIPVGQTIFGANENDYFGANLSMSADGSRFVVGVRNSGQPSLPGYVMTYELHDEQWDTIGQILPTESVSYTKNGIELSADGQRMATFVNGVDEEMDDYDAIQVYEWQDNLWVPLGTPILPTGGLVFRGVLAMSADGETIAVNGERGSGLFRCLTYRLTAGEWLPMADPIVSNEMSDLFGYALSLSDNGQRLAVGVPQSNANRSDSGNVLVYDFIDGRWVQAGQNIPGDGSFEQTGFSVCLSGNGQRLVVGDRHYDEPAFNAGRMRVFEWVADDWQQIGGEVLGEERADFFGMKVLLSQGGSTVAGAGPQAGGSTDTNGQIKVFGEYPWVNITSVKSPNHEVHLFPNPVQNRLRIDAPLYTPWQLSDLSGKLLLQGEVGASSIDLSQLTAGVYSLRLRMDGEWINEQVVKQ